MMLYMKIKIIMCLSFLVYGNLFAQPDIKVTADKDNYVYGDTIKFSITISNPTTETLYFSFPSSCQFNYLFDNFDFSNIVGCAAVLTGLVLSPDKSISRDFRYPGYKTNIALPAAGGHILIGKLIGYDYADTVIINIVEPTDVNGNIFAVSEFQVLQNYPNPFNNSTVVEFSLPESSIISFIVYNSLGQQVYQESEKYYTEGNHHIYVNLEQYSSGTYLYRIKANSFDVLRKMIYLK